MIPENELSTLFVKLYLDEDVHKRLAQALRLRGFDVISAYEVEHRQVDDKDHLTYAAAQSRAIVTFNIPDFVQLHKDYVSSGKEHWGIILSEQLPISEMAHRLLYFLNRVTADEMKNQLRYLQAPPVR
jgi:predicted nuclease of predicted toxin-antitoxin system